LDRPKFENNRPLDVELTVEGLNPRKPVSVNIHEDTIFKLQPQRRYTRICVEPDYMMYSDRIYADPNRRCDTLRLIPSLLDWKLSWNPSFFTPARMTCTSLPFPPSKRLLTFMEVNPTLAIAIQSSNGFIQPFNQCRNGPKRARSSRLMNIWSAREFKQADWPLTTPSRNLRTIRASNHRRSRSDATHHRVGLPIIEKMAQRGCIALFLAMLRPIFPTLQRIQQFLLLLGAVPVPSTSKLSLKKLGHCSNASTMHFEHNIQIKLGQLGEVSADIGSQSAIGAFLPNVNGNLSHGYNFGRTIDPFTNQFVESSAIRSNSFGISTGMVLFNGFQNHLNLESGETRSEICAF
jgi:hypothetical protein